jgi:uncharacterized protein YndB with AHSA1/START domain
MASDSLRLSTVLPVPPERVYRAWLDSREHTGMTGSPATVDARLGGAFSAWKGYIKGLIVELEEGRRIVMNWRTDEFPRGAADSRLEVLLEPAAEGTRLTLVHTGVPARDVRKYELGWKGSYFSPMNRYFSRLARGESLGGARSGGA